MFNHVVQLNWYNMLYSMVQVSYYESVVPLVPGRFLLLPVYLQYSVPYATRYEYMVHNTISKIDKSTELCQINSDTYTWKNTLKCKNLPNL